MQKVVERSLFILYGDNIEGFELRLAALSVSPRSRRRTMARLMPLSSGWNGEVPFLEALALVCLDHSGLGRHAY
jgi:hypothetical protein